MKCERCAAAFATDRRITVLLDYGIGNGTRREEVSFTLCDPCYDLASATQPIDPDRFFEATEGELR